MNEDNMYTWNAKLYNFPSDSPLAKDLAKRKITVRKPHNNDFLPSHETLRALIWRSSFLKTFRGILLSFESSPLASLFGLVTSQLVRFTPLISYRELTFPPGGSICMELLTKTGWQPSAFFFPP